MVSGASLKEDNEATRISRFATLRGAAGLYRDIRTTVVFWAGCDDPAGPPLV
jgi:hypothetical protein